MLFTSILIMLMAPFSTWACDVLKVEIASNGRVLYAGSAIPVMTSAGMVAVTADHVFPIDVTIESRQNFSYVVSTAASKVRFPVRLIKRDWFSDLLVFSAIDERSGFANLTACRAGRGEHNFSSGRLIGYPVTSQAPVSRVASVLDLKSEEIRIARPVSLIHVLGQVEHGMSGGGLFSTENLWQGLILQSGAFVLPASYVVEQVNLMMSEKGRALEMAAPYSVRRERMEMIAYGFRFRLIESVAVSEASKTFQIARVGGGHPDGIGGIPAMTALEVVGLSGDAIPASWLPMEKILRRIQAEGGTEMIVTGATTGQPATNLLQLSRLLFLYPNQPPPLVFSLRRMHSGQNLEIQETPETLIEQLVILAFELAESSPDLAEMAANLRELHGAFWSEIAQDKAQRVLALIQVNESRFAPLAQGEPRLRNTLIKFRVLQMKLTRMTGRS